MYSRNDQTKQALSEQTKTRNTASGHLPGLDKITLWNSTKAVNRMEKSIFSRLQLLVGPTNKHLTHQKKKVKIIVSFFEMSACKL